MNITGPWLVIGDLNEVVDSSEKFGGRPLEEVYVLEVLSKWVGVST